MTRYTLLQRLLHWIVAVLVIGVLGVGLTLGFLGFEGARQAFGETATNVLYNLHKTFGVIVLALMTLRLIARLTLGRPEYTPPLPRFNRVASEIVHGLLYVALLAQPMLGWAATAAGGFPVEFFNAQLPALIGKDEALSKLLFSIHGAVGWVILTLIAIHVGAALLHAYVKRDTVMQRMSLF